MKYFTKEELEDITRELIQNPTRETLKKLNEKYNGNSQMEEISINDTIPAANVSPVIAPLHNISIEEPKVQMSNEVVEEKIIPSVQMNSPVVAPLPTVDISPEVNPIPSFNVPSIELASIESTVNNTNNNKQISAIEVPKLDTPVFSNQNNKPINFSGNLWESHEQEMGNLMQTTDNFSAIPNTIPNTEVSVSSAPFFGVSSEPVNNPIPIGGPVNNIPNMGPSMFGEMQQNYM